MIIILSHISALCCVVWLTTFTVFSKITFFAAFYTYAIFKLLLLLQSPLKCLLFLRFLVWPLLPILLVLFLKSLISRLALVFFYNSLVILRSINSILYYSFYTCYSTLCIGITLLLFILLAFFLWKIQLFIKIA